MASDPFLVAGPALISFSGGRTSAYMLHEILRAHDGKLPDDVHVTFANTGKEREETLRFVHECETRWGVRVHWLERLPGGGFAEVGYNSASRNGEPFETLIGEKKYLPNAVTRFCTVELKIRPMRDFAIAAGFERWNNVVGLRYDEGLRVMKALERNDTGKERFKVYMPMSRAHTTKRGNVFPFWFGTSTMPPMPALIADLPQGFDLGLEEYEGNCDLCFLKSKGARKRIIRDKPGSVEWWKAQEARGTSKPSGARFVTEYRYADLEREVHENPFMPGLLDDEYDAECGLHCGPEGE